MNESNKRWAIILGIAGLANTASGLWMLAAPGHWYFNIPAGVPDTGPMNEHFIRDIGCVFLVMGLALLAGAAKPTVRLAALVMVTAWHVMHSMVHVADTFAGRLEPAHWLIDTPGVYGPTVLLLVLTVLWARTAQEQQ
jgi:hypothetical protein